MAQAEWVDKLSAYDEARVRKVVDGWQGQYPPSLPDIQGLCKSTPACHRQYKALPKPKGDPELASKFIGHAKNILRG